MNDFPANLAQRPLRIASQLTFPSQPVSRNHYTHHEVLPPQNTPSQARRQSTRSVYIIVLIASLKVCFEVLFLRKEKKNYNCLISWEHLQKITLYLPRLL